MYIHDIEGISQGVEFGSRKVVSALPRVYAAEELPVNIREEDQKQIRIRVERFNE